MGRMSWHRILEAKQSISDLNKVMQWDDSAGREAFYNAKDRFWAKINDLPCNTDLPSPDTYIDQIDWNPTIDPNLVSSLEVIRNAAKEYKKKKVIFTPPVYLEDAQPTGWDVIYEEVRNTDPNPLTGMIVGDGKSINDDDPARDGDLVNRTLMENSWDKNYKDNGVNERMNYHTRQTNEEAYMSSEHYMKPRNQNNKRTQTMSKWNSYIPSSSTPSTNRPVFYRSRKQN